MNNSKTPAVAALLVVCVGLASYFAGRQSAPPSTAPVNSANTTKEVHDDEHAGGHGEEKHGEEHTDENHGEAGHEEDAHGHDEHGAGETITFEGDSAREAGVRVEPVKLEMRSTGLPFNGEIEADPNRVVRVSSLVPGRVTRMMVSIGDRVRKGQTLAIIESRAIGEAQSAYRQAMTRQQTAQSNLAVVLRQAQAGVFSRGPLEAARKAQVEAVAAVREQETAVRQAQVALDNAMRLAKAGSFANPALEAARSQAAGAEEAETTARAALDNAKASVEAAQSELERRKQQAAAGAFQSRPVEEAKRVLSSAKSARNAAQSEVATTRANLQRAKTLSGEGLISQRDLEAAQNAFDTATANLEGAEAEIAVAQSELERQQKLAATNVAGLAQVQEAQAALSSAQADVRTRTAELKRAEQSSNLAKVALERETAIFREDIANRREVFPLQAKLETERNALQRARQTLNLSSAALAREQRIFQQNLNNIAQVEAARAAANQAQSDAQAARTALALLKSAPGRTASVPISAPISGVVQSREAMQGEVLGSDAHLLTLADLSEVHVDLFLPERDFAKVKIGSPVRVSVDALPGRAFSGFIELIHTELDKETRTVEAHASIRNPGNLRVGMFARGQILSSSGTTQITVPADAVQDFEDKQVVFVAATQPNAFVARPVRTGSTQDGRTVIQSGLKPGERIVVKGAFVVKAQAMKAELGHEH